MAGVTFGHQATRNSVAVLTALAATKPFFLAISGVCGYLTPGDKQ